MADTDLVTQGQVNALLASIAARGPSRLYTGSDAYIHPTWTPTINDYFLYDDGGSHPGWLYKWNGTDWDYAGNLKGSDGAGIVIGSVQPTPATGMSVFWIQDLGSGNYTFNMVTGD